MNTGAHEAQCEMPAIRHNLITKEDDAGCCVSGDALEEEPKAKN